MPTVIPVKFKYAARDLWFDPQDTGAQEGDHVICSTERGDEIGLATMDAIEMDDERLHDTIGDATLKPVLRIADDDDLDRAEELAERGDEAFPVFRRLVAESGLDMKPVGVEFIFGGGKAVCYFSAEERVDFRQLVRDLSHELHERIDMRQIGVREEAAIIGGFAHCGQELCCARFGKQFEPVSIRMAKEQDLPLNSAKISGACGRLMCCLRYEFEAYRDFKSRAPKRNAVIETPLGKGKIIEYDTPKEQICLRLENGKQVRVALADMETSEAAVKKSEELNCPCRPDTVTRAALDKLESPEIKMALAELDRQMGIVPDEGFDESDIFVETKPRRRRRKSSGESQEAASSQKPARAAEKKEASSSEPTAGKSRRRRRKTEGEATAAPVRTEGTPTEDAAAPAPSTRRRRRHHVSSGEQTGASHAQAQDQASGQETQAERPRGMQPKRRRRPGDRGGAAAQQVEQAPKKKSAPKHKAPAPQKAKQQPKDAAAQADGQQPKPKRRRRHRGGRGRGKGAQGEAGTQTPSPSGE
jgi:cell fate regulator YaaT (PSP1 superfamily)